MVCYKFFTIALGTCIFATHRFRNKSNKNAGHNRFAEINRLKRNGDKIRVTLNNADVKTISCHQEVLNGTMPSRIDMLDALYDKNRNHKTEEVRQTYIIFHKQYGDKTYRFVSNATLQDADAFKRHIEIQKGVDLYIDSGNPSSYYFDLPLM